MFVRLKWNVVIAVLAAYLIQLPWLWITDIYLAGMDAGAVKGIVVALLFSNILWALCAKLTTKRIRNLTLI